MTLLRSLLARRSLPARRSLSALGVVLLLLAGCAPDETLCECLVGRAPQLPPQADDGPVVVGQAAVGSLTVELETARAPHAGYNVACVRLLDAADRAVAPQALAVEATAADGTALPTSVGALAPDDRGCVGAALWLLTPDASGSAAQVHVAVTAAGEQGRVRFDVPFEEAVWLQPVAGGEAARPYLVAWVQPQRPRTGEAPFVLALRDAATLAPLPDATLDLYPYMDMGGGDGHSTPYEAPVHTGGGRYEGMINFIMAGGWELTVKVIRPGLPPDTVRFAPFSVF